MGIKYVFHTVYGVNLTTYHPVWVVEEYCHQKLHRYQVSWSIL